MLLTDKAAKTRTKTTARRLIATLLLTTVSLLPAAAQAADSAYRTEYGIYIFGMTIARSEITTRITDTSYALDGKFHSSGIAKIFDSTKGSININGTMLKQGSTATVQPVSYLTTYRSGKKHKRTSISFKNGSVSGYDNQPPINKVAPWVELGANDLKAVFDPISSMMITSPSAAAVCNRTLQIFDGQTRA